MSSYQGASFFSLTASSQARECSEACRKCWRDVAPASCILIQLCTRSPWALQRIRGNLVAMAACFPWHAGTEAGLRGTNLRPPSNKKEDRKASLSADAADEQPVAWPPPRLFSSPMRAALRETNASWQAAAFLCLLALRDVRFCSAVSVAPRSWTALGMSAFALV